MTLATGTKLGPYEILGQVGAGGMGEVYKARDTRLERTVAVKVLPVTLSASEEIRQRFEREAKTVSFSWDVTADGERFLVSVPVVKSSSRLLDLVMNWPATLRK